MNQLPLYARRARIEADHLETRRGLVPSPRYVYQTAYAEAKTPRREVADLRECGVMAAARTAGNGGEPDATDAVARIVGALAYALLRVFQLSAQSAGTAPTLTLRERQAAFAVEEFERYQVLRRRLGALTQDAEAAMAQFRGPLDSFYDAAPAEDWLSAQVFQYIGDAISTDFAELIAPHLDEKTAAAVREGLAGRAAHEAFALEQILKELGADPEAEARVAAVTGVIVGNALGRLREAIETSDALAVVLGGEELVKDVALELLGRHRERLERLGLDRVD
jgi:tRNA-(MS[2]IO[6]A)-hydroxylase (MiaE)-like